MSVNVKEAVGAIQEAYDFLTGGDSKMAPPLAKVFLCLSIILGASTYIMADKYFALIDDSRKLLLVNGQLNEQMAKISKENEELKAAALRTGIPQEECKVDTAPPPRKSTYEETAIRKVAKESPISRKRLLELIND